MRVNVYIKFITTWKPCVYCVIVTFCLCYATVRLVFGGVFVNNVDMSTVWICQQCGFVNSVDLSTAWICQQCGFVNNVDMSTVWICQQCGFVNSVDLSTMWICQQRGFVNSVDLSTVCITKMKPLLWMNVIWPGIIC